MAETVFDSKSPENEEFKPLIKSWTSLNLDKLDVLQKPKNRAVKQLLETFVSWGQSIVTNTTVSFLRADYREMVVLPLIMLGELPPSITHKIRAPGGY